MERIERQFTARLAAGMCVVCGQHPALLGDWACTGCVALRSCAPQAHAIPGACPHGRTAWDQCCACIMEREG